MRKESKDYHGKLHGLENDYLVCNSNFIFSLYMLIHVQYDEVAADQSMHSTWQTAAFRAGSPRDQNNRNEETGL